MLHLVKKLIPNPFLKIYHYFLAKLSPLFYGSPSEKMTIVGVTGTGGKSTTIYLAARLLEATGWKVGATSTVFFKIGEKVWLNDKKMTMLGRFQTQQMLAKMVQAGCQAALVETTSQGIEQFRHLGINYDMVALTNLYPEHLEAHGGFENYKKAKGKLFAHLSQSRRKKNGPPKTIIINADDENAAYFLSFPVERKITFSLQELENVSLDGNGACFVFNGQNFNLPLLGKFNLYNILCAIKIVLALGVKIEQIQEATKKIQGVPGRLEFIDNGQPFKVLIDYAFEPKAIAGLYETIKMIPHQKVIHVLGSAGGGRDQSRRVVLGRLAGEKTDYVIVTNEDPYDEDPRLIIEAVARGAEKVGKREGENLFRVWDRRQAIKKAFSLAQAGDLVLITGKGAEQAICVKNGRKIPWDDRQVAREEL